MVDTHSVKLNADISNINALLNNELVSQGEAEVDQYECTLCDYIDERYKLKEKATIDYKTRTELNVIETDGTLIKYTPGLTEGFDHHGKL